MTSREAATKETPPKQVSRFEASLLRILRFFFHHGPAEEALPLIRTVHNRPVCLSAASVHLVRDTLSKGCVLYLVKAGGWKNDRFLRNGEPKAGRLWQRSKIEDLQLEFSRHSLEFLIWLTAHKPGETKPMWRAPEAELTPADRLLLFLAYEALREEQDIIAAFRSSPTFAGHALCLLAYGSDFADEAAEHGGSFDEWFTDASAPMLEAMQPVLQERWLESERSKGQIGDWQKMKLQGQAESRALDSFLNAAERAGRWDLTRFLLGVFAKLLATSEMTPPFWTGGLQGSGPPRLADRLEIQRSALALLRQTERLRQWEQRARTRGFMDDDYAACKFWLAEWERYDGDRIVARAEKVLQMLEPLRPTSD